MPHVAEGHYQPSALTIIYHPYSYALINTDFCKDQFFAAVSPVDYSPMAMATLSLIVFGMISILPHPGRSCCNR